MRGESGPPRHSPLETVREYPEVKEREVSRCLGKHAREGPTRLAFV